MKILYVVNDIEYFLAHRAELARGFHSLGHTIIVAAGNCNGERNPDGLEGFTFIPLRINRHSFNPRGDIQLVRNFSRIIKEMQPDVVHSITIKPNLYVGLAAAVLVSRPVSSQIRFVMTFAGLGKVFETPSCFRHRLRRFVVEKAMKYVSTRLNLGVTFENARDLEELVGAGVFSRDQCIVMMGAGIDLEEYKAGSRSGRLRFLLASRMIAEKGVDTYLAIAKRFHNLNSKVEFQLAGAIDDTNPDAVTSSTIKDAENSGSIVYKGFVAPADMPELLADIDVVCLPTRLQEGLPRILLEGAASGCAIIASDQPACQDVVHIGKTGWLLKKPDEEHLFMAIRDAVNNIEETRKMGKRAQALVHQKPVSDEKIREHFQQIYNGSNNA